MDKTGLIRDLLHQDNYTCKNRWLKSTASIDPSTLMNETVQLELLMRLYISIYKESSDLQIFSSFLLQIN